MIIVFIAVACFKFVTPRTLRLGIIKSLMIFTSIQIAIQFQFKFPSVFYEVNWYPSFQGLFIYCIQPEQSAISHAELHQKCEPLLHVCKSSFRPRTPTKKTNEQTRKTKEKTRKIKTDFVKPEIWTKNIESSNLHTIFLY